MSLLVRSHRHVFKIALLAGSSFVVLAAAQPQAPFPQVANNTHSLMVESFDEADDGYNLSLRSNSPVAVYGVAIAAIGENGVCDLHTLGSLTGSFIEPSGHRALPALDFPDPEAGGFGPRMGACAETAIPERQPENPKSPVISKIVIEAVDFEDGSYEGDRALSAMFEAQRLARGLQRLRIAALVAEELQSLVPDDPDWVKALQTGVSELPVQPDADTVHLLQLRFSLSAATEESIREEFQDWSKFEDVLVLNHLKAYVSQSTKLGLPIVSLQTWWDATKGECEFVVSQRSSGTL
jgi:hypothetical protein